MACGSRRSSWKSRPTCSSFDCLRSHSGTTGSSSGAASSPSPSAAEWRSPPPEGLAGASTAAAAVFGLGSAPFVRPPACSTQVLYISDEGRSRYGPDSFSKFERSSAMRSCSKSTLRRPS